jgi:hypothetical protein
MPLADIVNVVITRQTPTITEQGFGIPLIFGASNRFTDLIKFYSDMDEVAVDFEPTDPEYIAAQDVFSQAISPNMLAIGRRQVDDVTIEVITGMTGEDYVLTIDGIEVVTSSTSTTTYSVVNIPSNLVPENRIAVSVNGANVGTTTAVIDFDVDFVTGNNIVARINGANMASVPFATDQVTTIGNLATSIAGNAAITGGGSATVTGPRQITVVFRDPGNNVVDSVLTNSGATQPVADIAQGGFVFNLTSADTMQDIADAIALLPNIDYAIVTGSNSRTLTVMGTDGNNAVVNSFVVTGGAS